MKRITLSLIFILSACQGSTENGKVIDKSFSPSRVGWTPTSKGVSPTFISEQYTLLIRTDWGKIMEVNAKMQEYGSYKVGDDIGVECHWYSGCEPIF